MFVGHLLEVLKSKKLLLAPNFPVLRPAILLIFWTPADFDAPLVVHPILFRPWPDALHRGLVLTLEPALPLAF